MKTGKALRFNLENQNFVAKKKDELNKKNIELKKKYKEIAQSINKNLSNLINKVKIMEIFMDQLNQKK